MFYPSFVFCGVFCVVSFVFCVVFCVVSFVFCVVSFVFPFHLNHCIVCPPSIYCFWLPVLVSSKLFVLLISDVRYDVRIKTMFDSSLPPVVWMEWSCLIYVFCGFLFAHSGVQHILCCVFVLFVFVFCTLCC